MATAQSPRKAPAPAAKKAATPRRPSPAKTSARTPAKAAAAPMKAAPMKAAPAKTAPLKGDKKKSKPEKVKVVRDSFTTPKAAYAQIGEPKKRALALGQEVTKSELIRAGLLLLSQHNDAGLRKALAAVPTLKTGRPGKA